MSIEPLPCPQCSAQMEIDAVRSEARCPKCGAVRAVELVSGDAPAPKMREPLGMPPYALWLFLSGVAAAALIFPVLRWWEARIKPLSEAPAGPHAPAKLVWDVTRPPILRDLDGDGVQDLIGRFRPDEGGVASMRVGAFSGKTLAPMWTTDSLGEWADAIETVQVALAGNALLLTDSHGGIELHVASTGDLVHRFALVSPAVEACAASDGTMRFWVKTRDGRGFEVEDSVPQPTPSPRPAWCPEAKAGPQAHLLDPKSAPAVAGFAPDLVLNEGTDAVALGTEHGTPTLVAFDPSRSGIRWQLPVGEKAKAVPLGADLVEGVLYAPYQVEGGRRLEAVDLSHGKAQWDIAIPGRGPGTAAWERIIADGSRVYVPEPLGLAVYEAASGRRVGTLGE